MDAGARMTARVKGREADTQSLFWESFRRLDDVGVAWSRQRAEKGTHSGECLVVQLGN